MSLLSKTVFTVKVQAQNGPHKDICTSANTHISDMCRSLTAICAHWDMTQAC